MKVLKFGGSSLANPTRFKDVADIAANYAKDSPIILVLSAPQGVTNALLALVTAAQDGGDWQSGLNQLQERFKELIEQAVPALPEAERRNLQQISAGQLQALADYAKGIA